MRVCVVVGDPNEKSPTFEIAHAVATRLAEGQHTIDVVDLAADTNTQIGSLASEGARTVVDSHLLIVASPTCHGTYTGLLKTFFDGFTRRSLRGIRAVPLMTGSSRDRLIRPDVFLHHLLVQLGASTPTTSLFIDAEKGCGLGAQLNDWMDQNAFYLSHASRAQHEGVYTP